MQELRFACLRHGNLFRATLSEGQTEMIINEVVDKNLGISTDRITEILDYVNPKERCVLAATVNEYRIDARVRFDSPQYTKKPVEYLSSSTLAISLAQVAHILIDTTVRKNYYPFQSFMSPDHLEFLRQNHEMYFVDLTMKFRRRRLGGEYPLTIELLNSRRIALLAVHSLRFGIGDSVNGSCRTVVPLIGHNCQ